MSIKKILYNKNEKLFIGKSAKEILIMLDEIQLAD